MSIEIICECGKRYRAKQQMPGKLVRCKACGGTIRVEPQPDILDIDDAIEFAPIPEVDRGQPTEVPVGDEIPPGVPEISPQFASARTYASNPALLRLDFRSLLLQERMAFGSALMMLTLMIPLLLRGYILYSLVPAGIAIIWLGYLLHRLRQKLAYGDVNPAIIVGEKPWRVAVYTDLTTGRSRKPAIKIIEVPMDRMTDGPPEIGKAVACVSLYVGSMNEDAWHDFSPEVVHLRTSKVPQVRRIVASIAAEDWNQLANAMTRVDLSRIGFYKLWKDPRKNLYKHTLTPNAEIVVLLIIWAFLLFLAAAVDWQKMGKGSGRRSQQPNPVISTLA